MLEPGARGETRTEMAAMLHETPARGAAPSCPRSPAGCSQRCSGVPAGW
jgi:hypothetical protein